MRTTSLVIGLIVLGAVFVIVFVLWSQRTVAPETVESVPTPAPPAAVPLLEAPFDTNDYLDEALEELEIVK